MPTPQTHRAGALCVSLDFELGWGMRDCMAPEQLEHRMRATRAVIPQLLQLFDDFGVRATWATVGLLLCEDADEAREIAPPPPLYQSPDQSPYPTLSTLRGGEAEEPVWFATSLVRRVSETPGQEIAAHTFGHICVLEAGLTLSDLDADLQAFREVAGRRKLDVRSLVFPRNQYTPAHITVAQGAGFDIYRGNPEGAIFTPRPEGEQSAAVRALRLVDAYALAARPRVAPLPNPEHRSSRPPQKLPAAHALNVPATRFLRPYSPALRMLDPARVRRVVTEVRHAARSGSLVHVWFHPHNFAANTRENFAGLRTILDVFSQERRARGMRSMNMGDFAQQ